MTTERDAAGEASVRRTRDLDGDWAFVTDPENNGRTDRWFDPASWPTHARDVDVPHVWQEHKDWIEYTGTAWYRRTLEIDTLEESSQQAFLVFDAVDYETTVWVNGVRVGENRGGYLPFEFEVTDALDPGANTIIVAVTDPDDLREIPHGKQGDPWYTRVSGIWQSVRLEWRPPTYVSTVRIIPDVETDTAAVEIDVETTSEHRGALEASVHARLDGAPAAATTTPLTEQQEAVLEFDAPTYWHPDNPALYDIIVTLEHDGDVIDRYEDYFGMRNFEARDGRFYLNGDPIEIRGVLEQGYYPRTLYRPPDEETFIHEIDTARALGFNLIRKHLKPAHPAFLEYADHAGMLVWQEPANPTRYTDRTRAEVSTQLHSMLDRDYNRPSVVIWGIYNEEWGIGHHDVEETLWTDTEKQRFLADQVRDVRERDPSRVVCDNSGWAHVATDINDYHRYFVSPDRADAWASDLDHICHHPGDNYATTEFEGSDAPILISEFGTWGLPDVDSLRARANGEPNWFSHEFLVQPLKRPAGVDERFEQSNLSDVFEDYADLASVWGERELVSNKHLIEEMRTRDAVAGYVLTELSDIEWEFNGLLDYYREPKSFGSSFAAVNAPLAVVARPDFHVAWAGDPLTVTVTVVNDTPDTVAESFRWSCCGNHGERTIEAPPHGVERFQETCSVDTTEDGVVSTASFSVTGSVDGETVATKEPITVIADEGRAPASATVFAEGAFASRLAEAGVTVTHRLSEAVDIAFTSEITARFDEFASDGGAVVHIPGTDGEMTNGGPFTYRAVPQTESWNVVASFYYQDSALLEDICGARRLGWEFEGIYPNSVATNLDASIDRVHVGYVEGWLANWGSPLVVRGYGRGSITALTIRACESYGRHPVATLLCNRLIRWLNA